MESTERNIVNNKECSEEVLSKDESSGKSINSDTQIESFSSLSGEVRGRKSLNRLCLR